MLAWNQIHHKSRDKSHDIHCLCRFRYHCSKMDPKKSKSIYKKVSNIGVATTKILKYWCGSEGFFLLWSRNIGVAATPLPMKYLIPKYPLILISQRAESNLNQVKVKNQNQNYHSMKVYTPEIPNHQNLKS